MLCVDGWVSVLRCPFMSLLMSLLDRSLFPPHCDFSCFSAFGIRLVTVHLSQLLWFWGLVTFPSRIIAMCLRCDWNTGCSCPMEVWGAHLVLGLTDTPDSRIQVWWPALTAAYFRSWLHSDPSNSTTAQSNWTRLLLWMTPLEETFSIVYTGIT